MAIKNIKDILTQGTALPAAIEAKLPTGAPKVSTTLLDIAGKIPVVPDFPIEAPDLPAVPELPEFPMLPELPGVGGAAGLRRYVTGATVNPTQSALVQKVVPQPFVGLIPEVITRRGM